MKDQGDLDKRPRLPGKINDHRPRQKADSWKRLGKRKGENGTRIGYGLVIEWFPGWRVTSSIARIQFDIHQYLAGSRVFCIADKMSEAANLQTALSRSGEDNDRQLLELHVLPTRLRLHTRRSASLSVHTSYFSKETSLARKLTRVRYNRIPLTVDSSLSCFRFLAQKLLWRDLWEKFEKK